MWSAAGASDAHVSETSDLEKSSKLCSIVPVVILWVGGGLLVKM